jgi:hypothetical protein
MTASRSPIRTRQSLHFAGRRQVSPTGTSRLDLGLFCHIKGIINFNAEIADSAFLFRVAEQQLYSAQILGSSINQRCFCPPQRMSAVTRSVQSQRLNPRIDDPSILAC